MRRAVDTAPAAVGWRQGLDRGMQLHGQLTTQLPRLLRGTGRRLRQGWASLTLRQGILIAIFAAPPLLLYGELETADRNARNLVMAGIQRETRLTAQSLAPILAREDLGPDDLGTALAKYAGGGTTLRLLLHPAEARDAATFYYVASAPPVGAGQVDAELDALGHYGIAQRLAKTCRWDSPIEIRTDEPDGTQQILTAIAAIPGPHACWVLVSARATPEFLAASLGHPYWATREIRLAIAIYLAGAAIAGLVALSVWGSLRRFRRLAHEARARGDGTAVFSAGNVVPELASVAADFDQLVRDLHGVASGIREAAEDNAHSFKTPLATVQACSDALQRRVAKSGGDADRVLTVLDAAVAQLRALVAAAQRLEHNTADIIEAPRTRIDLTHLLGQLLIQYGEVMTERGLRLARRLDEGAWVRASAELLEVAIGNILDNALSFSPPHGTIFVTLSRSKRTIALEIEDEGPGIDPEKIGRIFERYVSLRPNAPAATGVNADDTDDDGPGHSGLGLWIVQRNVTALGGTVTAANRVGGGLSVRILLPTAEG